VRFTAEDLAAATGGRRTGPDVAVEGVSIDTRQDVRGRLFVPVPATRDGHDFIADGLEAGAAAYLTQRAPVGGTAVVVEDTVRALADIGSRSRDRLPDRIVGITGSVGKTTVKDLLAAVLRQRFRVAASEGSFNNELGVPLTLANAPDDAEVVVVEMGARGIGHIATLCRIARPTIGIVTAVGHGHTEFFGTREDVARGKAELVASLPPEGVAVLNGDDPLVRAMASGTRARVVFVGSHDADVTAEEVAIDDELRASFLLRSPAGSATVRLRARGAHQVSNALAAAAGGLALGVTPEEVAVGLGTAVGSPWRMALTRTATGALVLNDAYNANPLSMAAALRALAALPARNRVAVLGTMAELGALADAEHLAAAELALRLGLRVVAVGEDRYGGDVEHVRDIDEAGSRLGPLGQGDAVLVKGSRMAGLERLAARLVDRS
jgi:UDP-N-acetylmuramoyl-tripeptide--D-alanyl-D-alanine ligase